MKIFIIIIAFAALLILIDISFGVNEFNKGTIVDMQYKPEKNSHGTGIGYSSDGTTITTYSTEHEPAEWIVILQDSAGEIITTKASNKVYYQHHTGDTVEYKTNCGLITNIHYWHTTL